MSKHNRIMSIRADGASKRDSKKERCSSANKLGARSVPQIYEVVIECRHEREQRAVFERMRGEGYRCRLMTL
jgi:hypothetical protein